VTTFREALASDGFAVSAELNLTEATGASTVVEQAALLRSVVDGVQVTDNPYGRVQIPSLVAAGLLIGEGIDPIPHMSCRNRNRTALASDLIGARILGVESLVLLRGEGYANAGGAAAVFELDARELIAMAEGMNDDDEPLRFNIGTIATLFKPSARWQPKGVVAKIDAGAQFIQTQLCFDPDVLKRYMAGLVSARVTWRASVVVSVATLPDAETARWLQRNLRGAVVPEYVVSRMDGANDPESEGVAICAELIQAFAEIPGVSGVNVMTPGDMTTIPAAIRSARIRPRG
jgi:methylenetetrahydrofolate reductase (NADPH)